MDRGKLLFLAIFGISLFSFSIFPNSLPITLAYADVVIGLLLVYSLIRIGRFTPNSICYATLAFAMVILLSGIVNIWRDATFDIGNFAANYIRVIALVGIVFLLPPLLRRIGHDRLATATMWVVRLQCAVVLADSVSLIPAAWKLSPEILTRPIGMFDEPGWFGVWLGLSVFYVIQVQRNLKRQYIGPLDIGLVVVSVIASTGMRGVIIIGFAMALLFITMGMRTRLRVLSGIFLTVGVLAFATEMFPDTGPGWGWDYVAGRGRNFSPFNMKDGSTQSRIDASGRLTYLLINDAPLLGTGLGGANQERLALRYYDPALPNLPVPSSDTMPTLALATGGLPGLLLFVFIVARVVMLPDTRLLGIGFALVAFAWGGLFESVIWWYFALAVALVGTRQEAASKLTQHRELQSPGLPAMPGEAAS